MAYLSKDYSSDSDSDIPDLEVEERIEALETLKRKRNSSYLLCANCPDAFKLFKSARRFVKHEENEHILTAPDVVTEKDKWLNPNLVIRKIIPVEEMSPLFSSESESDTDEDEDGSILSDSEDDIPDLSAESSDDDDFFLKGSPQESEDEIPDLSADEDEESDGKSMSSNVSYFYTYLKLV